MLRVLLALLGALIYGGSDFIGGRAATQMSSIKVTAVNAVTGVIVLLVASFFIDGHWNGGVWLWGVLAGLAGAVSLGLLYACLAVGPMSILAPIMALVSAVVPIGVGFASGERLSLVGYLGLVVGLLAIVLICFVPDVRAIRPSNKGIVMAAGAGLAVGLYLVFIDRTPHDSGITPLIISFSVGGVVMGTILLVQRIRASRTRIRLPAAGLPRHLLRTDGCGGLRPLPRRVAPGHPVTGRHHRSRRDHPTNLLFDLTVIGPG
jgi:drug/metabolite transporter (DMT)-like permease